MSNLNKNTIGR